MLGFSQLAKKSITFPKDGIVPFFKVAGMSSATFLNHIKYHLSVTPKIKVGHSGTLDRDASGILIVGFGKGTKQLDNFLYAQRVYSVNTIFGKETNTLDESGDLSDEFKPYDHINLDKINEKLKTPDFIGEITQKPPLYSAIKLNGKRLSDHSREGKSDKIKLVSRKVTIYQNKCVLYKDKSGIGEFELKVSSGFYVRSFVRDIAESFNTLGYASQIFRKCDGPFTIDDCLHINTLTNESLVESVQNSYKKIKTYEFDSNPSRKVYE